MIEPDERDWEIAARACREIAELPDRIACEHMTSDDMIVTARELQPIIAAAAAEARRQRSRSACAGASAVDRHDPSDRDIQTAREIMMETLDTCGIRHVSEEARMARALAQARRDGRREAFEECTRTRRAWIMRLVNMAYALHPRDWRIGWHKMGNWPLYRFLHLGPIALLFVERDR